MKFSSSFLVLCFQVTFQKVLHKKTLTKRQSFFISQLGGVRGIRTLDPGFSPDAPLAGVCLQPLSHYSVFGNNL